jgi:hypothetical protein
MQGRALLSFAAVAIACCAAGCAVESRYDLRIVESQKDAFVVIVRVEDRLAADEYHRIAETEVEKILSARLAGDVPVYEVQVDFVLRAAPDPRQERLATFLWRSRGGEVAARQVSSGEKRLLLY